MNPYEQWYGIPLIDDIHNYFPDILYNPDQFTSVRDLTNYIANSVRHRFHPDLVATAADAATPRLTMNRYSTRWTVAAPPVVIPTTAPATLFTSYHIPAETRPIPVVQPSEEVQATIQNFNTSQNELLNLVDLTLGLLGARGRSRGATGGTTFEPVRVGATAEQLDAASRVLVVSDTTINTNCAICMEPISVGDTCRRIIRCHHIFHKGCIDPHFQRSVRCPLCRIDIRELEAPAPATAEEAVAAPAPTPTPHNSN